MKEVVIFAGANGSGKSTLAKQIPFDGEFINADIYAKKFLGHLPSGIEKDELATIGVMRELMAAVKCGKSFSYETVLGTSSTFPETFFNRFKKHGYKIIVHYVGLESPEMNVRRVKKRVAEGGHDIPVDKILGRYEKAMKYLPQLMTVSDLAILYDNSIEDERGPRPFMLKAGTYGIRLGDIPNWAKFLFDGL